MLKEFKELNVKDKLVVISNFFFSAVLIVLMIIDILKIKNNLNYNSKSTSKDTEYATVYKPADNYSFDIDSDGRLVFSPIK